MTRKIALLLLAVAVILATLRLVLTSGNDAPSPQDVSVERNDAGARATGESADLALVGGPDQSTREASAVPSPASTDVAPQAAVDDGVERRRLVVRVEMNDGGTPPDELEVFALERGVPGGVLANAVSSTPAPPSADGPSVFDELDDPRNERVAVLSAVLARATVTGDVDDGWTALLEIPAANRRVFVHAYGDGAFTFRATEVFQDSEVITLRPGRGASLRVAVGLGDDARGARLDETRARLGVSADAATLMAMGATAAAEFGVSVDLDDAGVATFATVPAGVELRLRLSNDGFAAIEETVPALEHGETRELELTASRGATIRGRVVDDEGLPIGGAKVTGARPGRMFGFDDSKVTEATSAEDGTFSLERLPDGVAIVRADSETALQSSRLRVSIEDGRDAEGVEIVLEKGKAISGIARFASGVVAAGIDVRARFDVSHIAGPSGMAATRGIEASATTDGEGRFRLTGLGNGPFSVRASGSPGSDDATEWLARLDGVRPGAENLALELHPPLQVAGLVRDEAGTPLASVDVLASRVVPGSMGDMRLDWRGTTTDEEGRFTVEGVVTGNWALSVATLEYVTLEDVHLDVDGPVDDASLVAVRTGTIRGRVVGPDGSPLEGARVEQRADRPDWMAALSREVETARTRSNDDGTFLLLGVRPGKVVVAATSDELSPAQTDALDVDPGGTLEDVELRLMNGGAIEGIVFEDDGSPASGRVVQVQSPTLAVMRPVSTGDDGTFEIRGLPAGSYQLVAMDPSTDMSGDMDAGGIASMLESIDMATADVVEGETVIVYIGAPPADPVEVSGRVEQGGEPFTGAMVVWMPASESMYERMKMTTTDEDGNYRLTLDEPGDYMVSVARMGGSTGQQETVEFSESIPDDTAEFERDFEVPGGTIAGRVGGPDAEPVPGARLTIMATGSMRTDRIFGGSYAEVSTDAQGAFEVSGLRAGSYQVAAGGGAVIGASASASARTVVGDFELTENGRIDGVEIRLSEPGALAVRVVDAAGVGVAGATVFLRDEAGRHTELFSMVVTDQSGVANCTGLAPGRYTVAARSTTDASEESTPIEVRSGEKTSTQVLMGPGATIIAILRSKGDAPIPAGSIQVLDSAGRDVTRRIGLTDMQSLYSEAAFSTTERRIGPVPPGRYKVLASTADGRSAKRYVTIDEGGERRVSLVLR